MPMVDAAAIQLAEQIFSAVCQNGEVPPVSKILITAIVTATLTEVRKATVISAGVGVVPGAPLTVTSITVA